MNGISGGRGDSFTNGYEGHKSSGEHTKPHLEAFEEIPRNLKGIPRLREM